MLNNQLHKIILIFNFVFAAGFEWCCHTWQLDEDDNDEATTVTVIGKTKELPAEWIFYINEYYAKKIKAYSLIIEEYEKAKHQRKKPTKTIRVSSN